MGPGGLPDAATLHVRRTKKGSPSAHPIIGDELRALRRLKREQDQSRLSCSRRSVERRSAPLAPLASSGRGSRPSLARHTRTCSGTPAAMRSPTRGTTRGRCRLILATGTSTHSWIHRVVAHAVQELLAHLTRDMWALWPELPGEAPFCPLLDQSNHSRISARNGLSANDPKRTSQFWLDHSSTRFFGPRSE